MLLLPLQIVNATISSNFPSIKQSTEYFYMLFQGMFTLPRLKMCSHNQTEYVIFIEWLSAIRSTDCKKFPAVVMISCKAYYHPPILAPEEQRI